MKVKNINGTSRNTCGCGSWLAHWERFSGQSTPFCQAKGCIKRDVVGAHVQKAAWGADRDWYVYPLCNEHNRYSGELEVSDTYALVPANVAQTCGKGKTLSGDAIGRQEAFGGSLLRSSTGSPWATKG